MQSRFLKGLTLFVFFGLIAFFVACKTGALDKKNPPPRKMGSSKSGVIFTSDKDSSKNTAAKDSALPPPNIETDPKWMYSSKSGRVFEPSLPDTFVLPLDTIKKDSPK
jgi:hypothetical protein